MSSTPGVAPTAAPQHLKSPLTPLHAAQATASNLSFDNSSSRNAESIDSDFDMMATEISDKLLAAHEPSSTTPRSGTSEEGRSSAAGNTHSRSATPNQASSQQSPPFNFSIVGMQEGSVAPQATHPLAQAKSPYAGSAIIAGTSGSGGASATSTPHPFAALTAAATGTASSRQQLQLLTPSLSNNMPAQAFFRELMVPSPQLAGRAVGYIDLSPATVDSAGSFGNNSFRVGAPKTVDVFLGQLSHHYTAAQVTYLVNRLSNADAVVRTKEGPGNNCSFVTVIDSAADVLLSMNKRVLCDRDCAWVARTDAEAGALRDLASRTAPSRPPAGIPKGVLVVERARGPQHPTGSAHKRGGNLPGGNGQHNSPGSMPMGQVQQGHVLGQHQNMHHRQHQQQHHQQQQGGWPLQVGEVMGGMPPSGGVQIGVPQNRRPQHHQTHVHPFNSNQGGYRDEQSRYSGAQPGRGYYGDGADQDPRDAYRAQQMPPRGPEAAAAMIQDQQAVIAELEDKVAAQDGEIAMLRDQLKQALELMHRHGIGRSSESTSGSGEPGAAASDE